VRFLLLGNLLGSMTPLLFAYIDAPGVWPAGVAMMLAGLSLGAFAGLSGRFHDLSVAARKPGIWVTGALLGAVTCAVASSVSYATLVAATFLAGLAPVFTLALAPLFGESATRPDALAVLLGVVGAIALALSHGRTDHRSSLIGVGLALFGAGGSAVVLQTQRRFAVDAVPAIAAQAMTLLIGGLVVLPFGAPPSVGPRRVGLVLVISTIFAVSNVLLFRGLRTVRASQAVSVRPFGALVPIVAGPFVLHQPLDVFSAFGATLAVVATTVAALQAGRGRRAVGRLVGRTLL
jgi:drug/metabolite transporter (DMT)-like permease